jgi:integrase
VKITATPFFDEMRACWRVRLRGGGVDTKANVPDEEFEAEGVSPTSTSTRARNVAAGWAMVKRAELLGEPTPRKMTLQQVFDLMRLVNPDDVTEPTWKRNEIHIRNLKRLPSDEPLGSVAPEMIDGRLASSYRNERVETAAGRTVGGELTFLIRLLRFGYEEAASKTGMTAIRLTTPPKIRFDEQAMVALTVDQFFRVLEATAKLPRCGDITRRRLIFGVTTLLRKTPLMGLCAEWLDLDDPWLDVPASAQKGRRGEKRPLSVPLCGWAVEQLPRHLPRIGLIWPNPDTQKPTGNVTHTLQKLAREARVPEFSLHDLRATGNTWLANEGVDERIREYLMGHAGGGAVIDRYTKITAETQKQIREAVAVFDQIRGAVEGNVASIFSRRRSRAR